MANEILVIATPGPAPLALGSFCSSDPTHDPSHTMPVPYVVVSVRDYPYVPTIARSGFNDHYAEL